MAIRSIFQRFSIITWLNLWVGVFFLLAGLSAIYLVNQIMKEQALLEAKDKARILLDRSLATHFYMNRQLKPAVFKITDKVTPPGYFEPVWMSSTYAIREIDKLFKKESNLNYYYKECAINARSPQNEADEYEQNFIRALNKDEALEDHSEIRMLDGQLHFVVLRRGEAMEKPCLRCHSTPDRAPAGLVEIYGPERSFGRHEGEVVSAISIRVPLTEAFARANRLSLELSLYLVAVLIMLFLAQFFLSRRLLFAPLMHLVGFIEAYGQHAHYGPVPQTGGGKEIIELTDAFNRMASARDAAETEIRTLNRNLEARVQARTAELEAANRELDTFAYSVSHDLRAPLRALDGFSEALTEDYKDKLDETGKTYLCYLRDGSRDMARLIDGLLSLSRSTRGELEYTTVDLSALAENIVRELRAGEPQRQVDCRIVPGLRAQGDLRLLKTVLRNLLGNAWKYTVKQHDACIELSAAQEGDKTIYCISDNGAGFDMRYADKLFQPFQRLHSTTEFSGAGIGLATVQRIIHRHGGTIRGEGIPGQGARFFFSLLTRNPDEIS